MNDSWNRSYYLDVDLSTSLTQRTCGQILAELVKFILYQKLQIPFPYERLKFVVNRKRSGSEELNFGSLASSKQFRIASVTLDNLDFMLKSLQFQVESPSPPKEVCISFGTTSLSLREVYRIVLPQFYHKSQCSQEVLKSAQSLGRSVLRTITTSPQLEPLLSDSLEPTSMFISIKKQAGESNMSDTIFNCWNGCRIPKLSKVGVIQFQTSQESCKCCDAINIYNDDEEFTSEQKIFKGDTDCKNFFLIESDDNNVWFQSSVIIKGFRDCLVNGSSVTDQWIS